MTNDTRGHLYGFPIIWNVDLTLADQIADILRKEIFEGRWTVGERLPSLSDLVSQTGLSRDVIQRAMDQLKSEGYIRQEQRKGTFLEAVLPHGAKPLGTIGIAVPEPGNRGIPGVGSRTEVFGRWRFETLLMQAGASNFTTMILPISREEDWAHLDLRNGPFGSKVDGIISLRPIPHRREWRMGAERIPVVFLGVFEPDCYPCVTGDGRDGAYWMTRRILDMGHREVAVYCHPYIGQKHTEQLIEGHRQAMEEAGLTVNLESVRDSMAIGDGDPLSIKGFIDKYSKCSVILSLSGEMSVNLCDTAELAGYQVPEDISIVSLGHGRSRSKKVITGMAYDWEKVGQSCIDLLVEQMKARQCSLARLQFRPHMIEYDEDSHTLALPKQRGRERRRQ